MIWWFSLIIFKILFLCWSLRILGGFEGVICTFMYFFECQSLWVDGSGKFFSSIETSFVNNYSSVVASVLDFSSACRIQLPPFTWGRSLQFFVPLHGSPGMDNNIISYPKAIQILASEENHVINTAILLWLKSHKDKLNNDKSWRSIIYYSYP